MYVCAERFKRRLQFVFEGLQSSVFVLIRILCILFFIFALACVLREPFYFFVTFYLFDNKNKRTILLTPRAASASFLWTELPPKNMAFLP